jgi:hypothetical protein
MKKNRRPVFPPQEPMGKLFFFPGVRATHYCLPMLIKKGEYRPLYVNGDCNVSHGIHEGDTIIAVPLAPDERPCRGEFYVLRKANLAQPICCRAEISAPDTLTLSDDTGSNPYPLDSVVFVGRVVHVCKGCEGQGCPDWKPGQVQRPVRAIGGGA